MANVGRWLLLAVGLGATVLFEKAIADKMFSGHALLNAEGVVALSVLLLIGWQSRPAVLWGGEGKLLLSEVVWVLPAAVLLGMLYGRTLSAPFIYDDYTHIADATRQTWAISWHDFGPLPAPGIFFRPMGSLLYWITYWWAGTEPVRWHLVSLLLHATNCCLLYAFSRQLGWPRLGSLSAAFLFAVNAVAAETVAWIDARFDLMVTCLVLLCLLAVCRYLASGNTVWLAASLLGSVAAALTKESGFCVPLLVSCLLLFRPRSEWRRLATAAVSNGLLLTALFLYRWWALGGIGGYRDAAGAPHVLQFQLLHTLHALFVRVWAVLLFPINWTVPDGSGVFLLPVIYALLLLTVAWQTSVPRQLWAGCLLFTLSAALPVQHMLLIGTDLLNSRELYLPATGMALLWGGCLAYLKPARGRLVGLAALLLSHSFLLTHNLRPWRSVPEQVASLCQSFGSAVRGLPGTIRVERLPSTRTGVVFLANGFSLCVERNSGIPAGKIIVGDRLPSGEGTVFRWNPDTETLEQVQP